MVDRIRQLIQARQLSPTQFADAIGVARPIVSHILGGRNKPSLEVVQKIIAAFPDIALPWLLSGQGDMLGGSPAASVVSGPALATSEPVAPRPPARRSSRSSEAGVKPTELVQPSVDSTAAASGAVAAAVESAVENGQAASRTTSSDPQPLPTPAAFEPAIAPLLAHSTKSIRRVLIFYSDGTFADFSPSQDAF